MARLLLAWTCLLTLTAAAPLPVPRKPKLYPPPAPLLQVKFIAPAKAHATFYNGILPGQSFQAPALVGLRPGYTYRFRLGGISDRPNEFLYPTLQVIGSLHMPPPLCSVNHPVPVEFTEQEIEKALTGSFLTKVYYLEHPDKAVPVQTDKDQPLITDVGQDRDVVSEARASGRPLLIVRFGHRQATEEELAATAIPGTLLLPEEKVLPIPPVPPVLPWDYLVIFDPKLGPRPPEEECLIDGGDYRTPVGFDPAGQLRGLDPSDTVAEYVDSQGNRRIAISNEVCICVPRYGIIRTEILPSGYDSLYVPINTQLVQPQQQLQARTPPLTALQLDQPGTVRNRERPVSAQEASGPITYEQTLETGLVIGQVGGQTVVGVARKQPSRPDLPLLLCKWSDKPCFEIGDVVTFYLKYTNPGGQPITDVVVSDSLTARLEYVPGSQKADRDAVFTTQENNAGSVIVRWEIKGTLLPGQSGTVSFQARIR